MKQLFNAIAVAVPAQQFVVRSFVLLERQVPVMTEFSVRLLHIAGPLELSVLQGYFGLTPAETRELLTLLRAEGLVEEVDGRIALTSYAVGRFVGGDDSLPRFTRIAERVSKPIFEMLSFSPLPRSPSQYWDNTLDLEWKGREDGAKHKDLAEEAFHRYFHDIEFLSSREDDRNRAFDVYKVTSVTGGKHFNIPVPIYFTVDLDGNVDYEFGEDSERLGSELMSLVTQLTADRIGRQPKRADHFRSFVTVFEDSVLSRYLGAPPETGVRRAAAAKSAGGGGSDFDFGRYVREVHGMRGGEVYDEKRSKAVLGVLYLEHNRKHYLDSLRDAILRQKIELTTEGLVEAFWVLPASDVWGRTTLIVEFIREMKAVWREQGYENFELTAVLATSQSDRPEKVRRMAHLFLDAGFDDVLLGPAQLAAERFEVLLTPRVHGAALYEWTVPGTEAMSVPLGFVTEAEDKLRKLLVFLQRSLGSKQQRAFWSDPEMGEERKLKIHELLPGEFFYLEH